MKHQNLVVFLIFPLLCFMLTNALTCLKCDLARCINPVCKGGKVPDICGCCQVCAKLEGESCGGDWDLEGICDENLECVTKPTNDLYPSHYYRIGICNATTATMKPENGSDASMGNFTANVLQKINGSTIAAITMGALNLVWIAIIIYLVMKQNKCKPSSSIPRTSTLQVKLVSTSPQYEQMNSPDSEIQSDNFENIIRKEKEDCDER